MALRKTQPDKCLRKECFGPEVPISGGRVPEGWRQDQTGGWEYVDYEEETDHRGLHSEEN